MKDQKKSRLPLSEQEMKGIKGGHVYSSSQYGARCPLCGKENNDCLYSFYIKCANCGHVITLKEEENDAYQK